jgi:phosphate uptake regulator
MDVAKRSNGVFHASAEKILEKGLSVMSKACDALTTRNKELEEDVESLEKEIGRIKNRLILETGERE